MAPPELLGRQSSHYTRIARIFALELDVALDFTPIHALMSLDPATFGGNPALKLPILRIDGDAVFGTANICRTLARHAGRERDVFWPEEADRPLLMNAHELLAHAMAVQVEVVMHEQVEKRPPDAASRKRRDSLIASLHWLDTHLEAVTAALPPRPLRWFDVALFCLLQHIPFRNPLDLSALHALQRFEEGFARRASAVHTPYRFDPPPGAD